MENVKAYIAYLLVVVFVLGSIAVSAKSVEMKFSASNDAIKALEQQRKTETLIVLNEKLKKAAGKGQI